MKPPMKQPVYDKVEAGDIIAIGDDQWFVKDVTFFPTGWNPFEGGLREYGTDNLTLNLLRVNGSDE